VGPISWDSQAESALSHQSDTERPQKVTERPVNILKNIPQNVLRHSQRPSEIQVERSLPVTLHPPNSTLRTHPRHPQEKQKPRTHPFGPFRSDSPPSEREPPSSDGPRLPRPTTKAPAHCCTFIRSPKFRPLNKVHLLCLRRQVRLSNSGKTPESVTGHPYSDGKPPF